jgi:hypothetical protein
VGNGRGMVRSPGHLFAYVVYSFLGARGATATRHGLDALYLFPYLIVMHGLAHINHAVYARVRVRIFVGGGSERALPRS